MHHLRLRKEFPSAHDFRDRYFTARRPEPEARSPRLEARYFNFSYSAFAVFKTGTSESASFQTAKKS